jgi:hypothetical protein
VSDDDLPDSASKGAEDTLVHVPGTDLLLVELLNEMEAFSFSYDLTLTVQGFLISGMPVFLTEYLEGEGARLQRAAEMSASAEEDPRIAERLRRFGEFTRIQFSRDAEAFRLPEAPEGDAEAEARLIAAQEEILKTPRENIILKRVTMLAPSGELFDIPFWRGRLNLIAGWSRGRVQQRDYHGPDPDAT